MSFQFEERHLTLNLLDLLFEYQLIDGDEYSFFLYIKKQYLRYIHYGRNMINELGVKTQGGKMEDRTEQLFASCRKYLLIEHIIKENTTLLKETILINKQAMYFYNDGFYDFVNGLLQNMDYIYDKYKKYIKY